MSSPILELRYDGGRYSLDTDAYNILVGWMLLQEQLNKSRSPIGYWSISLTKAEKAHFINRQEHSALLLPDYYKSY